MRKERLSETEYLKTKADIENIKEKNFTFKNREKQAHQSSKMVRI